MAHWDDVASVRAALKRKLGKQLANDFRHDRHGEVFLSLSPDERDALLGMSAAGGNERMWNKVAMLARVLASEGRLEESLTIYEAVAPRVDASLTQEVLALIARGAFDPDRVRRLLVAQWPRIEDWASVATAVSAVALRIGEPELAIDAVRAGVIGGLDPTEMIEDERLAAIRDDARFVEATRALFAPHAPAPSLELPSLSAAWNDAGRTHLAAQHPKLVAIYERGEEADIDADPRDRALADRVIEAVVALRDQPGEARRLFDPASAPLVHRFGSRAGQPITFATILGPDDALVRAGPSYRSARVLRLRGAGAELVPGVIAVTANRAHTLLALARPRVGIEVRASIDGPVLDTFAWPDVTALLPEEELRDASVGQPLRIDQMSLSGDGTRLLIVGYRQGVLLGSRRANEPAWRYVGGAGDDMLHADLSDDGAWLVHGGQSSLHELIAIDADGTLRPHASVGPRGEYPHCARFTDDGRGVALNACHFYEGGTGYFETSAPRGLTTEHYADTPHLRVIDGSLRVYAASWLPAEVTSWLAAEGAFALVGAGVMRVVSTSGALLCAQALGSSGASADYHPSHGLLAIGTYAGQLHVFDVRHGAAIGREDGWTRGGVTAGLREVRRWLLWPDLPGGPVAW